MYPQQHPCSKLYGLLVTFTYMFTQVSGLEKPVSGDTMVPGAGSLFCPVSGPGAEGTIY